MLCIAVISLNLICSSDLESNMCLVYAGESRSSVLFLFSYFIGST